MRRRFMNRTLSGEYLTITAICDSEVSFINKSPFGYLYYRKNSKWRKYSEKLVLSAGESVQFKGNLAAVQSNIEERGCGRFTITGGCNISGYCDSILSNKMSSYCFYRLFEGCDIINASCLILPATTLEQDCYNRMFSNCTSLTTAPELPATTLAEGCYFYMFYGCTKLNYIKMLATDISAGACLNNWVGNVASSGTFVKNPAMTSLPTGDNGIPSGWTVVNDGEESGGSLTFPVTLIEGDNGQLGIDVYNFLIEKYGRGYYGEIEEDVYIYTFIKVEYLTLKINDINIAMSIELYNSRGGVCILRSSGLIE